MADRQRTPAGLGAGGQALWRDITDVHTLDAMQRVQLLEACRAKDRLDKLDQVLRGKASTWMELVADFTDGTSNQLVADLRITGALDKANATANMMKQLIAALRLPDEDTGKRPQHRGPRGAQAPTIPGGAPKAPTSLDRARERAARNAG